MYGRLLVLAILASIWTCPAHAALLDVRYKNPGGVTFDTIKFFVDGQPYVEQVSGCTPWDGTAPICVATLDLGAGTHTVQARAFALSAEVWTGPSNLVTVQGAPEPGLGAGLGLGVLGLGLAARRR